MAFILHKDVFRPARDPMPEIPVGVRSVGHYKLAPAFESQRKTVTFTQLFWGVSGAGTLMLKGRPRLLRKHQVAVIFPGMSHHYRADQNVWEFFWLTLDGPLAAAAVAAFGLEADIRDAGAPPSALFRQLLQIVPKPSRQNELRSGALAYLVLTKAAGALHKHGDDAVTAALEILHRRWNDPAINLKQLAGDLALGYTTLCMRFTRAMGVSPAAYLKRLRMQNALTLLQSTHMTIAEIARQCGYADPNYFCRAVRHVTGRPPGALRGGAKA